MPRHLISDAHEWINEILTVPIYPPHGAENKSGDSLDFSIGYWVSHSRGTGAKAREPP